uniref:Nonstructural protein n=1 Tax=Dulem virus 117 TaxID=3145594 RepID=A0AAU8B6J9_9VIRU
MDFVYGFYSVYDVIAGSYSAPMLHNNDAIAVREYAMAFANAQPGTLFAFRPKDFELRKVGLFDLKSGMLSSCEITTVADWTVVESMLGGSEDGEK